MMRADSSPDIGDAALQSRRRVRARPTAAPRPAHAVKMVVLGPSGAGKTALVWRFAAESDSLFLPAHARAYVAGAPHVRPEPTVAVDFCSAVAAAGAVVSHLQAELRMAVWDVSGDAAYAQLRADIFREAFKPDDALCALLVFDVTSRASFAQLDAWLEEARQRLGLADAALVVCGNKCDNAARVVSVPEARAWATGRGYAYFDISASSGEGVADALRAALLGALRRAGVNVAPGPTRAGSAASTAKSGLSARNHSHTGVPTSVSSASVTTARSQQGTSGGERPAGLPSDEELDALTAKELQSRIEALGLTHRDCLTREDLRSKLKTALRDLAKRREVEAERSAKLQRDATQERVNRQVEEWARNKDVRAMLNSIFGHGEACPLRGAGAAAAAAAASGGGAVKLERGASAAPVLKAYRRAVLLVHPDKHDQNDWETYCLATETFKALSSAYARFQDANKKRASLGAAQAAAAP